MSPEDQKPSILLVDDDPSIAWTLGKYLTRVGLGVVTCGDGEEAVKLLSSKSFDALVTDVQIPRLNGLALIEWTRRTFPDLLVVAITGFGSSTVQDVALRRGAVLYLEKPVDPALLAEVLTTRPQEGESFSGTIHEIDLIEYVQLLLLSRRQTVLEVSGRDGRKAHLYIDKGNVCHAELDDLQGEEAFYRCLEFEGGTFATQSWRTPERDTIELSGDFLLMEAARMRDEKSLKVPELQTEDSNTDESDDFFGLDFSDFTEVVESDETVEEENL